MNFRHGLRPRADCSLKTPCRAGDPRDYLLGVAHKIVEHGEFGSVEVGFFNALGECIVNGEVDLKVNSTHRVVAPVKEDAPDHEA